MLITLANEEDDIFKNKYFVKKMLFFFHNAENLLYKHIRTPTHIYIKERFSKRSQKNIYIDIDVDTS